MPRKSVSESRKGLRKTPGNDLKDAKKTVPGSWETEHLSHVLVGQLAKQLPVVM